MGAGLGFSHPTGVVYPGCDRDGGDRHARCRYECDVDSVPSFTAAAGFACVTSRSACAGRLS